MKVTVKVNSLTKGLNQKIEISFSSRPSEIVISELKKNGWTWMKKKGCWSNYNSDTNLNFALALSNRINKQYRNFGKSVNYSKAKAHDNDDPFANLRRKTHMRKKRDYGVIHTGANMTSVYDCKSRLVCQVC